MYLPQNLHEIQKYRPASLRIGKEWYIEYYVFNPVNSQLVRKKIRLNYIDKVSDRRAYANNLIRRLNAELEKGWNPFFANESEKSYSLLTTAIKSFMNFNTKKVADGDLRQMTLQSYVSKMNILLNYIEENKLQDCHVYQFNRDFVTKFLNYVYAERKNGSRTRDNYLKTIKLFCNYLVDQNYIKANPALAISVIGKERGRNNIKNRKLINTDIRHKLSMFLHQNSEHFLLITELIYFCMIRPLELSHLRVGNIDLARGTIFIPGEISKNWKDAVVTMPQSVIDLITRLNITAYPPDYYLFSDGFKPGRKYRRTKQMNDYWSRVVRPALGVGLSVKLYSLKDTGITDMIRQYNDPITVRDQARHSNLAITNIYTPPDMLKANEIIRKDRREF